VGSASRSTGLLLLEASEVGPSISQLLPDLKFAVALPCSVVALCVGAHSPSVLAGSSLLHTSAKASIFLIDFNSSLLKSCWPLVVFPACAFLSCAWIFFMSLLLVLDSFTCLDFIEFAQASVLPADGSVSPALQGRTPASSFAVSTAHEESFSSNWSAS
jgi:hypothetical protein